MRAEFGSHSNVGANSSNFVILPPSLIQIMLLKVSILIKSCPIASKLELEIPKCLIDGPNAIQES